MCGFVRYASWLTLYGLRAATPPLVANENLVTTLCTELGSRGTWLVFLLAWPAVLAAAASAFVSLFAALYLCSVSMSCFDFGLLT